MVPLLEAAGHTAVAADLPTDEPEAGWEAYAAAFGLDGAGDVIVVAHSLGGLAAPAVAAGLDARLIVLVSAMIALPGETGSGWWASSGFDEAVHADFDDEHALYFHDVDPALAAESAEHGRDVTAEAMALPVAPWPDVPVRALAFAEDRLFPPDFQRGLARERLGVELELVPGGHYGAISRPAELADKLLSLA